MVLCEYISYFLKIDQIDQPCCIILVIIDGVGI